jgi:hypothetical protein
MSTSVSTTQLADAHRFHSKLDSNDWFKRSRSSSECYEPEVEVVELVFDFLFFLCLLLLAVEVAPVPPGAG